MREQQSPSPRFSVIIVNYNSGHRLARCLDCLDRQTHRPHDIIVIDNQSADGSEAAARRDGTRLIEAGDNLGFAAANNEAAADARGDWLVFLNPDAYGAPDWLAEIAAGIRRYPWADAFGSLQLDDADPRRMDGAGDVATRFGVAYRGGYGAPLPADLEDGECFAPCAAAAAYRADRFRALGGFDRRFFCYGEDVDLGFRLRHDGGRAVQLARAIVRHEGSGVTGRHSAFTVYHGHRNRIWLYYKNMSPDFYRRTAPLRWLADRLLALKHAFDAEGRDAYRRALIDGYGGRGQFDAERPASMPPDLRAFLPANPLAFLKRARHIRPLTGENTGRARGGDGKCKGTCDEGRGKNASAPQASGGR